ncbi:MAG: YaiI/YqxD family protein [Pseudomonadales bacterium]|nr:YaiI/YqxD family protein [Pseudomonadales bacterium]MCP5184940.1 YaiI/YqxD family protein [Pseudomonadales bacterium]
MARIWVDADACPVVVRDIIVRAAVRTGVEALFVANRLVKLPNVPGLRSVQVPGGFDVADDHIARSVQRGDLVVTADIPLAAEVMASGAEALSPRGEAFSRDTIRQKLNLRDFMDTMRASGVTGGGPPPLGQRERMAFANALDRFLARMTRPAGGPP